ncbi:MAG TPA: hypothetical protein VF546_14015 [Pyrinomonadaceae bacterium]|jgi:hypothetical protein
MPAQPTTARKPRAATPGSFKPGPDARRHQFTPEECRAGFYAALAAIATKTGKTPTGTLAFFMQRRAAQRGACA